MVDQPLGAGFGQVGTQLLYPIAIPRILNVTLCIESNVVDRMQCKELIEIV